MSEDHTYKCETCQREIREKTQWKEQKRRVIARVEKINEKINEMLDPGNLGMDDDG